MRRFLSSLRHNDRGVALLLVMGSVFMITTIIVEFAFRSNIHYHLALNNADRLQAYYLAESALNFSKLLIKFDKDVQKQIAKYKADITVEPLYRMFPISSGLLRGVLDGTISGEDTETDDADVTPPEDADATLDAEAETDDEKGMLEAANDEVDADMAGDLGVLQGEEAKDFLSFTGDFELEVTEEDSKFDLNVFYDLRKTQADYDPRKRWLISLFKGPPFAGYFEDRDDDLTPEMLAYRLVDWVDPNEAIDELDGVARGNENDAYTTLEYTPKNGKFTSTAEIGMVPGVTPELLSELEPYLTIYNPTHQFNPCLADETLVHAFVAMYSQVNTCATALDPADEDDREKIEEITTSFLSGCPQVEEMPTLLDEALGISLGETTGETVSPETTEDGAVAASPCGSFKAESVLSGERHVFQLIGRGTVGDTVVEVRTVIDASNDDPSRWQFYYWRVN